MRLKIAQLSNLPAGSFYVICDGQYIADDRWSNWDEALTVDVRLRLRGGKGGFGSQLRSAGSQYQKSQNQDSCRDLSGRRLRDVEEERKLRKWIEQAAERERERAERKRNRLERLAGTGQHSKHVFQDESYSTSKRSLLDSNADAVDQGIAAALEPDQPSTSKNGATGFHCGRDPLICFAEGTDRKRKRDDKGKEIAPVIKGAKVLWTGIDEADLSSSSESEPESDSPGSSTNSHPDVSGPGADKGQMSSNGSANLGQRSNPAEQGSHSAEAESAGNGGSEDEMSKGDLVETVFGSPQPTVGCSERSEFSWM